jgi:hypothetical protein
MDDGDIRRAGVVPLGPSYPSEWITLQMPKGSTFLENWESEAGLKWESFINAIHENWTLGLKWSA